MCNKARESEMHISIYGHMYVYICLQNSRPAVLLGTQCLRTFGGLKSRDVAPTGK